MNLLFRFPLIILLSIAVAASTQATGADLPEKLKDALDRAKSKFAVDIATAQETLLKSFDRTIATTRSAPKLRPEERQQLIARLEFDRDHFEKTGHISFIPEMRSTTVSYLAQVAKAETTAAKAYDRVIEFYTKQKNDSDARIITAEKNQQIAPKIIAICRPLNTNTITWILFSNGTVLWKQAGAIRWAGQTQHWTLDQRQLVFRWKNPDDGSAYNDTCVAHPDGLMFDCVGQGNVKLRVKRETSE